MSLSVTAKRIAFFAALIGLWQLITALHIWTALLFPSPGDVLASLGDGFSQGAIQAAVIASMRRLVEGYVVAVVLGLILGMVMAQWKSVREMVGPLVLGMQTLPSICWLPLAVVWFGLNETGVVLVVVLGSVFAVTESVYAGLKNVPPLYGRAALTMGANSWQMFRRVLIPAALPNIVTGLKLSWSFAWRSLMSGELISTSVGLGQLLIQGQNNLDMGQIVGLMVVIVVIGLVFNQLLFSPVESSIRRRWGLAA